MADRIDKQGRLVIPKRIRTECDLPIGADLEFVPSPEEGGVIVRKKAAQTCFSCGSELHLVELSKGCFLCRDCIRQRLLPKT